MDALLAAAEAKHDPKLVCISPSVDRLSILIRFAAGFSSSQRYCMVVLARDSHSNNGDVNRFSWLMCYLHVNLASLLSICD